MSLKFYMHAKCFVARKVHKFNEEKMMFMKTFALSYVIACIIIVLSLIIECESIGSEGEYSFAKCTDIDMLSYIVFSLIQTFVTTTIPFASTIFILQSDEKKHKTIKAFVMILIIALALLCTAQSALSMLESLWAVSIVSLLLVIITVICCRFLFWGEKDTMRPIKRERSDGKPIT